MEEIKAQIAAKYDAMQILDLLGLDTTDLVELLEPLLKDNLDLFDDVDIRGYLYE